MKNRRNHLRFFRNLAEKSQFRLAVESGLSQAKISRAELEYIELREEDKKNLSIALGVTMEAIFPKSEEEG